MTEQRPAMRDGVIQRGETWSYVVRERDPKTGKTRPRWVGGFPTRTAARKARDAARHAVNRGTWVAPQDLTVGQWLDRWVDTELELKPSTLASYKANIERYLKPALGHYRVQELDPDLITHTFTTLASTGGHGGKPLSPRTVEFARAVLRRAMNVAVARRHVEVNPVTGSKIARGAKPEHATWTGAQLQTYLAAIEGQRWAPLWQLTAATGMRRGEVVVLRWQDVDLERGVVHVRRAIAAGVVSTPKNGRDRKVAIDDRTVAALRAWRKRQAEERLAWGAAYVDTDARVFTWENGAPVQPDWASKGFAASQAGLELPRLTLHELRHTQATVLLRAGTPVHIVSKRLGHRDVSVTLNVYASVIPEDDSTAVSTFTAAVWGAS
ncbi:MULTISPECIES: tyrosine-type recombinase/integrase [Arsenicicoccus]|uniref:tyrosine-type recombinase/integrase n=1 Tax=Arsenicicoccus TaxID=267408 RepID=UPI00257E8AC2|nr:MULTISPECIES: tyrosine-type recombinase/integrase [Arsenicicoccus]